jgi:hypothetical protein
MDVLSRYQQLRAVTARLAAPAAEQQAYLEQLFLPLAVDGDSSAYGCDELALEFEDYFISAEHMLRDGKLSIRQLELLRALDAILGKWSGEHHSDFWRRDALRTDPRWEDVRKHAQSALAMLPADDQPIGR